MTRTLLIIGIILNLVIIIGGSIILAWILAKGLS